MLKTITLVTYMVAGAAAIAATRGIARRLQEERVAPATAPLSWRFNRADNNKAWDRFFRVDLTQETPEPEPMPEPESEHESAPPIVWWRGRSWPLLAGAAACGAAAIECAQWLLR